MKEVVLSKGQIALIDDFDRERIIKHKWYCSKQGYAVSGNGVKSPRISMHRLVMEAPDNLWVDHINHNRLDNRRSNLRLATRVENFRNRGKNRNNTSGYKGVTFDKYTKKWVAQYYMNKRTKKIGRYSTALEAAKAYDTAVKAQHGEFSWLNFGNQHG